MPTALSERIGRIASLTDQLGDIIDAETSVLRDRRRGALADTDLQKKQLTRAYDAEMSELRENPSLLAGARDEDVARLRSIMGEFRKVLDEHNRALFVAKTVSERMIKAVADEVAGRDRGVVGYSKVAKAQFLTAPPGGRPISLALNELV